MCGAYVLNGTGPTDVKRPIKRAWRNSGALSGAYSGTPRLAMSCSFTVWIVLGVTAWVQGASARSTLGKAYWDNMRTKSSQIIFSFMYSIWMSQPDKPDCSLVQGHKNMVITGFQAWEFCTNNFGIWWNLQIFVIITFFKGGPTDLSLVEMVVLEHQWIVLEHGTESMLALA